MLFYCGLPLGLGLVEVLLWLSCGVGRCRKDAADSGREGWKKERRRGQKPEAKEKDRAAMTASQQATHPTWTLAHFALMDDNDD